MTNMKILMIVTDGVEEIEALMARDIFIRSGMEVKMMNINNNEVIHSSHQLKIDVESFNSDYSSFDALMLPGGKVGTTNMDNCSLIDEIISYFVKAGKLVSAICAAPSILGKRGYLKGHQYTCYPGWNNDEYGEYTGQGVVESGKLNVFWLL